MRTGKDATGRDYIAMGIFSQATEQISSYFSRVAAERNVKVDQPDNEDETPGEELQSVLYSD